MKRPISLSAVIMRRGHAYLTGGQSVSFISLLYLLYEGKIESPIINNYFINNARVTKPF